ncbi:MAG: methyltransferase domain-containing protein [Actinobacteria bacterium]|nr:MAG: methyltransferase domain-containing protein [Actinomycetota bacterium]
MSENYTLSDLEVMSTAKNYIDWQYSVIKPYIGHNILEVGAGIGNFTDILSNNDSKVTCVELDEDCARELQSRYSDNTNINVICSDILSDSLGQVLDGKRFDSIVCLNVLEHIENDLKAIDIFYEKLEDNGKMIVLVPSHKWLYGSIDSALGHFRRYSKKELISKLIDRGFSIHRIKYFNIVGMAGWFWNNRIIKRKVESYGQVKLYDKAIVPIQRRFESIFPFITGLSLVCIAKKNMEYEKTK